MNFHEGPLVLFTVLSQGAIGAFWWCFFALMFCHIATDRQVALKRCMIVLWLMMGVAFILSSMHLGSPFRALNSLLRIGQAPLSNEILTAAAFTGAGALCWFLSLRETAMSAVNKVLMLITLVCSVLFLGAMITVYKISTVPLWNTPLTCMAFTATTLIVGSAVAALLFALTRSAQSPFLRGGPLLVAGLGILLAIVVSMVQSTDLHSAHFAMVNMPELIEGITYWTIVRTALFFVGLLLWVGYIKCYQPQQKGLGLVILFVLALAGAEMAGRLVFYSLNMTVGLI